MKIRKNYEYDKKVKLECKDPHLTHQAFKDKVDAHLIVKRYKERGIVPEFAKEGGVFGEQPGQNAYQDGLIAAAKGRQRWLQLPQEIRDRFNNDPRKYLKFVSDEKNWDEMKKLGMLKKGAKKYVEKNNPDGNSKEAAGANTKEKESGKEK